MEMGTPACVHQRVSVVVLGVVQRSTDQKVGDSSPSERAQRGSSMPQIVDPEPAAQPSPSTGGQESGTPTSEKTRRTSMRRRAKSM